MQEQPQDHVIAPGGEVVHDASTGLHAAIMNLSVRSAGLYTAEQFEAYRIGHRDARHAAAELANAAEADYAALRASHDALRDALQALIAADDDDALCDELFDAARAALAKARTA